MNYYWKRSVPSLSEEDRFVENQQIEAYIKEANGQNFTGAIVWSLMIYHLQQDTPTWSWLPFLLVLYAVTTIRTFHIHQFRHRVRVNDNAQWGYIQTLLTGIAGICWGVSSACMLSYLSATDAMLLIALIGVSVSVSASEGASYSPPSLSFSISAILPVSGVLLLGAERWHIITGFLLLALLFLTQSQGRTRNGVFVESRRLMYRNQELARELSAQKEVAERANAAKTRFLASASHDMRQPLQSASLSLHLLGQNLSSDGERRILCHVEEALSAMQEILNGVLDISRLEAGVERVDNKAICLQSTWEKLNHFFASEANERKLKLRFRPSQLWVQSDPHHLLRVLQNLISNALRYTDQGGVLVAARARGNQVWVEIRDTGYGIPADRIQDIFQEFVQLNNPERDRNKGLGLGLAIVDRTIKLLGHELQVHSKQGAGSLFRIVMPRVEVGMMNESSSVNSDGVVGDISGMFVLVVEDHSEIRLALQAVLESWGCLVTQARDVKSACEVMEQTLRIPDVMLLDYRLPDGNGTDLARRLFDILGAQPPTFILTGDVTAPELTIMKNSGLHIMHKPFQTNRLRADISGVRSRSASLTD